MNSFIKKIIIGILSGIGLTTTMSNGQSTIKAPGEMKLHLNEDGSHYLKWTFSNQIWLRYNESNPGTTVFTKAAPETFDIGLRRTRIQFFGQITDHVFFYTQFGQNNFNFLSQKFGQQEITGFFSRCLRRI